jgi:hypothetical protein
MGTVLLFLQQYIQAPRLGELGVRAAIVAFYVWAGSYLYRAWPAFSHVAPAQIKNVIYPLLVYLIFGWFIFMLISPLFLRMVGGQAVARGFGRLLFLGGVYTVQITVMTFINLVILIIRIGVAAITPGNTLQTCVDAGTHFTERQADLMFKPMR